MKIFSLVIALLVMGCTSGYPRDSVVPPHKAPPMTVRDCMDTCDAQRELCMQMISRFDSSKTRSSCMTDWTHCLNMCMDIEE